MRVKVSLRAPASPPWSAASLAGNTSTKGQSNRDATAFANVVLPVPGGPNRTIDRGGSTPNFSARSESDRGITSLRSNISFSRCIPAIPAQRSLGNIRPPNSARMLLSFSEMGISRSKYLRWFLATNPAWSKTSDLSWLSGTKMESFVRPSGAIRVSSAASNELPIPWRRKDGSVVKKTIQPCSWAARATAAPTIFSSTTARTA